eukprot:5421931-Amphidinium_carterae.1
MRVQELESRFNLIVGDRSSSSVAEDSSTLIEDVELVHNNLRIMFAKMAITEAELEGSQVREAHRDQRLLGLLQEISSRVTVTETYAYNMNEMTHAQQAVNAGPNFPDLPALTHGYWGFIVPAERPPNWTVQDRSLNVGVITQVTDGLQQYNPQLVQEDEVPLNTAEAFAPAVQERQVQAVQDDEVPVQADQVNEPSSNA